MDIKLTVQLIFSLFSFNRKNMRWFNMRRLVVAMVLLPFFTLLLISNRLFMLLDYLLFPFFLQQKIKQPVYIVAAPRSATTFLFHLLAEKEESFTSFKLWELIFAPSIIQKYILLGFSHVDGWIGNPLGKCIAWFEKLIFGKFRNIHLIGLNLPEEDEVILFWNMSTIYLNFFFPHTTCFSRYEAYDDSMSPRLKNRIDQYYLRCIKRHNFVFNRKGEKRFLSKNPAMMSKVKSLHELFPDALILNINRNPGKVIPSTLALNENVYAVFTSRKSTEEVSRKTIELLVHWYKMAHENLKEKFDGQFLEIDFWKLISNDQVVMNEMADFLNLEKGSLLLGLEQESEKEHKSKNNYQVLKEGELQLILNELPFLVKYVTPINA